jgi:putative ABC transport system ATP-binding protein
MPQQASNPLKAATTEQVTKAPIFQTRALCKTYRTGGNEVRALQDVDLDIYSGEFIVLLGPSGSGKSTLLNILGGLDRPSTGSAHLDALPPRARRLCVPVL